MAGQLGGKRALVTRGSRGIGDAVAAAIASYFVGRQAD